MRAQKYNWIDRDLNRYFVCV